MSNNRMNNSGNDDLKKVESHIKWSIAFALVIILLIPAFYAANFYLVMDQPVKQAPATEADAVVTEKAIWGQFGDYIGGTLNPIMAALAFYWLTSSIRLQLKELQETRKQMTQATKAQQESATHQENIAKLEKKNVETQKQILASQQESLDEQIAAAKAQQQQIALQNFENLFFQLLSTLNNITNNIQAGTASSFISLVKEQMKDRSLKGSITHYINKFSLPDRPAQKGKGSIKDQVIFYKAFVTYPWENFYSTAIDDHFGSYFRVCYQIVKMIDDNEVLLKLKVNEKDPFSKEQKKYFDIFRAQLSGYELEAIFFNCLSSHGNEKFKEKVERYGLFEHLLLDHERKILDTDLDLEGVNRLTMYAYKYDRSVFEENQLWKKYFEELDTIKSENYENIKNNIDFLVEGNFISKKYFENKKDESVILKEIGFSKKNNYKELIDIPRIIRECRDDIKFEEDFIKYHKKSQITYYKNVNASKQKIKNKVYQIKNNQLRFKSEKIRYKKFESLCFLNEIFIILKYKINFDEYSAYQLKKLEEKKSKLSAPTT